MGLYDREYYQDEDAPKGLQLGGDSQKTMVFKIIIVTLVLYCLDAFSPVVTHLVIPKKKGDTKTKSVIVLPQDLDEVSQDFKSRGFTVTERVNSRWLSGHMTLRSDLVQKPWNFWKLISNGFAHSPIGSEHWLMHIGFNMFILFMFGRVVEEKYGPTEFLAFYIIAIVFSALAWLLVENVMYGHYGNSAVLGASGAVTAVVIVFVLSYPNQILMLMGVMPIKAWVVGVLVIVLNVIGSLGPDDHVSQISHIAGAGFGFIYIKSGIQLERLWPKRLSDLFAWLKPKPRLKVHDPEEAEEMYQEMNDEADRILEKLHTEGEDSLTSKERRILDAYSRRMRQKHR